MKVKIKNLYINKYGLDILNVDKKAWQNINFIAIKNSDKMFNEIRLWRKDKLNINLTKYICNACSTAIKRNSLALKREIKNPPHQIPCQREWPGNSDDIEKGRGMVSAEARTCRVISMWKV